MNLEEAMLVVQMGGTVTRRSWFGGAIVYLDRDEIPVKMFQSGQGEIYDKSEDLDSNDWEACDGW